MKICSLTTCKSDNFSSISRSMTNTIGRSRSMTNTIGRTYIYSEPDVGKTKSTVWAHGHTRRFHVVICIKENPANKVKVKDQKFSERERERE